MKKIIAAVCTVCLMTSCSFVTNTSEVEERSDILSYPIPSEYTESVDAGYQVDFIEVEESIPPRYGFTYSEVYLLAQLLCGNATYDGDGEYDFVYGAKTNNMNYCEMGKVLCVVMNRVRSDEFPNTVTDVVMQKNQFSVMPKNAEKTPDDVAIEKVQEWCDAYDRYDLGAQNIPESHLYFCAGPNITNVTREHY